MLRQLARFVSVGMVATLLHVTVALIAKELLMFSAQAANFAGFCAAVILSFFGHARVTFDVRNDQKTRFLRFVVVALAGLAASSTVTFLVYTQAGGSFWLAMAITAVVVPALTYLVAKFWVFAELPKAGPRVWPGMLLSLVIALLFYLVFHDRPITHDVAWYLVAMQKWREGAALYVDLVEINPPLAMYLALPALWLAEALGTSVANGMYMLVSLLLFASLSWVYRMLAQEGKLPESGRYAMLFLSAAAVTVPAMANVTQREHLMLIMVLPYVFGFLVLPKPDSGTGAMARASFAAIGLCMKPHFMLIPIALTIVSMAKTKSLKPITSLANLTFVFFGLLYIYLVAHFHPAYFAEIVPMGMRVYGAYGYDALTILKASKPVLLLGLAMVLLLGAHKGRGAGYLEALVIAALLIFLAQWTGYAYQALPIASFTALAAAWFMVQRQLALRARVASALLFAAITGSAVFGGFYHNPWVNYLTEALKNIDGPQRVMVLSTNLGEAFPYVLEANAEWTSRYPTLWTIPGALNGLAETDCTEYPAHCADWRKALAQSRAAIVSDLLENRPNILLVRHKLAYINDQNFSMVSFLADDPRFAGFLDGFYAIEANDTFTLWVGSDQPQ